MQYRVAFQDLRAERYRSLGPGEQVHPKGQVAFLECFSQSVQLGCVLWLGERNQVEVGVWPGVALYSRAVGPHRHTWQMGSQQVLYKVQVIEGKVDGRGASGAVIYSQVSPVMT